MQNVIKYFLILLLISSLSCNENSTNNDNKENQEEYFYYSANGEKNFLERIESKIVVTLDDKSNVTQPDSFLDKYCGNFKPDSIKHLFKNNFSIVQNSEMDLLKRHLFTNTDVKNINHYYYVIGNLVSNDTLGVFDQLNAKVKPDVSESKLDEIIEQYNLEIINKQHYGTTYRVSPGANTLEISNKLYEVGIFEYASPDFLAVVIPD